MENSATDINRAKSVIARMQRFKKWPLPASFLAIIGVGYFFTFYDISDIGFAMPDIGVQFNLSGSESLFLALSIGLIGYVFGSYIIGFLADKYGRYPMLLLTMLLMALGSFGDAGSINIYMLVIFRFITGLGLGADLNLIPAYIGEFAPAKRRGHMGEITFFLGILGQAVTPFIALALITPSDSAGWRWLFVIGGLIAVIAVILRSELPRSPRWLVTHGRIDKAEKIVDRLEKSMESKGEKLEAVSEADIAGVELASKRLPFAYLWKSPYRKRMVIFGLWWGLWYIGNYAFLGDAATMLSDSGITISSSILYIAIGAIGYPIGALVAYTISDKFERKYIVVVGSFIWLIGMILFGTKYDSTIIATGSFLAAFALAFVLGIAYMYTSESYPTNGRTSGFAMGDGLGHIGGAIGALLLPILVIDWGFFNGFLFIGITTMVAGLILLAGGDTSVNKQLENI
jgi:MFS family permease